MRRHSAPFGRASLMVLLALITAAGLASGCSSSGDAPATTGAGTGSVASGSTSGTAATGTTVAVAKDVLADQVDPPGAPGRTLTLIRYTIAPGAQLSPHIHPGIQLAEIESGTLTYTVVSGTVTVTHAGASGTSEQVTGPATIELQPGDAVHEIGDMVHFGANETDEPVVILATLLTDSTEDLAVTVTTTAPIPSSTSTP